MEGGGSSKKSQQVVQNNDPWAGVQPYLTEGYKDLSNVVKQGAPNYYPNQTVQGFAPEQEQAMQLTAQRATNGSPLNKAASGEIQKVLGGEYLNAGNPYFSQVVNQIRNPVDATYQAAGRYGSGAHDQAIANTAGQLAYQNYGDERARMQQAAALAPQLAQQDYLDYNALNDVGTQRQQQGQAVLSEDVNRHNYESNKDLDWISNYLAMLNGAQGGSTTTTQPYYQPSGWGQALGGGMAFGGALLNAFAS